MNESTNYARNIKTKQLVFAGKDVSAAWWRGLDTLALWAFWRLPSGAHAESFEGRIIGEDPQKRCERQNHRSALDACDKCRAKRIGMHMVSPVTPTERYHRKMGRS